MAVKLVGLITDFTWGAEDNIVVKCHLSSGQTDHVSVSLGPYSDDATELTINNAIKSDAKLYTEENMQVEFGALDTVKFLNRVSVP